MGVRHGAMLKSEQCLSRREHGVALKEKLKSPVEVFRWIASSQLCSERRGPLGGAKELPGKRRWSTLFIWPPAYEGELMYLTDFCTWFGSVFCCFLYLVAPRRATVCIGRLRKTSVDGRGWCSLLSCLSLGHCSRTAAENNHSYQPFPSGYSTSIHPSIHTVRPPCGGETCLDFWKALARGPRQGSIVGGIGICAFNAVWCAVGALPRYVLLWIWLPRRPCGRSTVHPVKRIGQGISESEESFAKIKSTS